MSIFILHLFKIWVIRNQRILTADIEHIIKFPVHFPYL